MEFPPWDSFPVEKDPLGIEKVVIKIDGDSGDCVGWRMEPSGLYVSFTFLKGHSLVLGTHLTPPQGYIRFFKKELLRLRLGLRWKDPVNIGEVQKKGLGPSEYLLLGRSPEDLHGKAQARICRFANLPE